MSPVWVAQATQTLTCTLFDPGNIGGFGEKCLCSTSVDSAVEAIPIGAVADVLIKRFKRSKRVGSEAAQAAAKNVDELSEAATKAVDDGVSIKGGSGTKSLGKQTTAADWNGKTNELAKSAPIDIPENATVKIQTKTGYDQITYKWSLQIKSQAPK